MTAAHCGEHNDQVQLSHRTENIPVANFYLYPDWENSYDLALLELEFDAQTPPALVAHGCASDYITNGATVTLVGWGSNHANPTPAEMFNSNLYQGVTTIVDDQCADTVLNWCNNPGGEFIAGGSDVDTCGGDSGGPVYVMTDLGPLVAGITSRVANGAARNDTSLRGACGPSEGPEGGIYVRPDAVIPWIEEIMGASLPEPDCSEDSTEDPQIPDGTDDSDGNDGIDGPDLSLWSCQNANNQAFPGEFDETNPLDYFGADDGCDCGCGVIDSDCPVGAGASSCGLVFCDGAPVDPNNISQCVSSDGSDSEPEPEPEPELEEPPIADDSGLPGSWSCDSPALGFEEFPGQFYNVGDGCDCGCGAVDPDCGSSEGLNQCLFNWCTTPGGIDPTDIGSCL